MIFNVDSEKLYTGEFTRATNLIDSNNKYTNTYITKNTDKMNSTKTQDTRDGVGHKAEIQNPNVGDMRYTRVVKKVGGDN